ncbi:MULTISPECIES: ParA family protein [Nostocales]|jgi:chromosome partitioning protein|uniref:AAA family ATPase n=2 Tax=Aphanizomenonaceae TaxID=1892259 RepID=A0ACC7S345_DOLFA|nr:MULTISPECIES: AAA family ATPase [Nostocales]MBD2281432.1 AAA family ATPase [Aphanizomenon flos-aquae FACHB-1040]MBO1067632.1 AAA family ATPase [Anabaena sp. 54]MBO1068843.1 AAA family ATPase [Dolichospermum sp. DEX189]MTJ42938.1 AAA family ATPase [Dolichospermum flos-aquae UHCC 0037]
MKVVSIINYKGGVGKTTITANLGTELACRGYRVLLIDADPQCSLTFSFFNSSDQLDWFEEKELTLKTFFTSLIKPIPNPKSFGDVRVKVSKINKKIQEQGGKGSLHLIASHLELINIDMKLAGILAGGIDRYEQASRYFNCFSSISQGLEKLKSQYDFVLIDCPPNFNIVTKTSIAASNYILIPSRPDHLSTLGISYLKKSVIEFVEEYNYYTKQANISVIDPKIIGVVFTMVKVHTEQPINAHQRYMNNVVKEQKLKIFDAFIRENQTTFAMAPEKGIPVVLSASSSSNIVQELKELVDEFEYLIN